MAPGGRHSTDVCRISEEMDPGHKTVTREATETDVDKALEKTTITILWQKVLQTAQISILNEVFLLVCFLKIQTKTTNRLSLDPGPATWLCDLGRLFSLPCGRPFLPKWKAWCPQRGRQPSVPPLPLPALPPRHYISPSSPSTCPELAPPVCPSCTRDPVGSPHLTLSCSGAGLNDPQHWTQHSG